VASSSRTSRPVHLLPAAPVRLPSSTTLGEVWFSFGRTSNPQQCSRWAISSTTGSARGCAAAPAAAQPGAIWLRRRSTARFRLRSATTAAAGMDSHAGRVFRHVLPRQQLQHHVANSTRTKRMVRRLRRRCSHGQQRWYNFILSHSLVIKSFIYHCW